VTHLDLLVRILCPPLVHLLPTPSVKVHADGDGQYDEDCEKGKVFERAGDGLVLFIKLFVEFAPCDG
jgi:hypothetical protein